MDFFARVNNKIVKLNKSENELLNFFVKNAYEIKKMKIQDAAEKTYTSPASIIRFCKKLGFSGYSEMKNNLAISIQMNEQVPSDLDERKEVSLFKDIQKTKELINDTLIDEVVDLIKNCKRIDFYGEGSSKMVCREMSKRFRALGYHAYSYDDSSVMYLSASSLNENDLIFAISMSGETSQVLRAANIAKTRKVNMISVTNMSANSLSKLADKSLYVCSTSYKLKNLNFESRLQAFTLMEYIFFKFIDKYK